MASPLDPQGSASAVLARAIEHGRVHSGYLLTGAASATRNAALAFLRALVCERSTGEACEACTGCRRSATGATEPIALDAKGKKGPTYRHVGEHAALFHVERGREDTRISVGQIRALANALRLRGFDGGRRAALVEGAESMNANAQNALLRILEEPPANTSFVMTAARPTSVLATIRSRCVRVRLPDEAPRDLRDPEAPGRTPKYVALLDALRSSSPPRILDLAEDWRGNRAEAAEAVVELIDVAGAWLHEGVLREIEAGRPPRTRILDAAGHLLQLRRDVLQRNANPQMVAERLLFGLRDAVA